MLLLIISQYASLLAADMCQCASSHYILILNYLISKLSRFIYYVIFIASQSLLLVLLSW